MAVKAKPKVSLASKNTSEKKVEQAVQQTEVINAATGTDTRKEEVPDKKAVEETKEAVRKTATETISKDRIVTVKAVINGTTSYISRDGRSEFTWLYSGDEVEMSYSDLCAMKVHKPIFYTAPWLIVLDKDVREKHADLKKAYDACAGLNDYGWLKSNDAGLIEKKLKSIPRDKKEVFLSKAKQMVDDGELSNIVVIGAIARHTGVSVDELTAK